MYNIFKIQLLFMFWLYLFFCWLNWTDFKLPGVALSSSRVVFSWAQSRRKEQLFLSQPGNIMSHWVCQGHIPSLSELPRLGDHVMLWFAMPEPPASSLEPGEELLWKHRDRVEQNHFWSGSTNRESKGTQSYTLTAFSMDLIFWKGITSEKCTLV